MASHADCDHPSTSAARRACRRGRTVAARPPLGHELLRCPRCGGKLGHDFVDFCTCVECGDEWVCADDDDDEPAPYDGPDGTQLYWVPFTGPAEFHRIAEGAELHADRVVALCGVDGRPGVDGARHHGGDPRLGGEIVGCPTCEGHEGPEARYDALTATLEFRRARKKSLTSRRRSH